MTPEQKQGRMRVIGRNGPIHIHARTDNENVDWFRYHTARASGRLSEYWCGRMQWYFWYHSSPATLTDDLLTNLGDTLYTFRTFREACDKVKEIFSE